jgi:hypothetical protein
VIPFPFRASDVEVSWSLTQVGQVPPMGLRGGKGASSLASRKALPLQRLGRITRRGVYRPSGAGASTLETHPRYS